MQLRCFWILAVGLFFYGWGLHQVHAWNPQVIGGTCKQSGNRCSSTIGNRGQGSGSCCDPAASNIVSCNSTNPCIGGKPYKWSTSRFPVTWRVNTNGMAGKNGYAGLSESQILAAMKKGWDGWLVPCTSFAHSYQGKTTTRAIRGDRQLVLYMPNPSEWAQLGAGSSTLAFTMPAPLSTGELVDGDIVYNPSPQGGWGVSSKTDLINVTAHEVGHAIGFAHDARRTSLMFYANVARFSTLPQDDRDAVCFTYPGSCTKDADCGACLRCNNGRCSPKNIAAVNNLCKPCTQPSDCGGANDICIRLKEGNRCAQNCVTDGCCPVDYRCSDIGGGQRMCVPDSGICPPVACTSDSQCGPGEQCSNRTCQPKPVAPVAKLCQECQAATDCGGSNGCFRFPDGKSRCAQPCAADNFCPTGYFCQTAGNGRFCFPDDLVCPCTSNASCASGERCSSGKCQPSSCKYGCACSANVKCDSPYECFQTQQGGRCFQRCTVTSGTFPAGVPGSVCGSGNACSGGGTSCITPTSGSNGKKTCLRPCKANADCQGFGGFCFGVSGGGRYCMCRTDTDCKGLVCNKTVMGTKYGACTTPAQGSNCEPNFECKDAGSNIKICLPKPIRAAGQTCSQTQACQSGLLCLNTGAGANASSICFEECTTTCQFGGTCILSLQGGQKVCGCRNNTECPSGKICRKVLNNGALGYCGDLQYTCGDGTCETAGGEQCTNCPKDCPCAAGLVCEQGACKTPPVVCGDNKCDSTENCGTCAKDCACQGSQVCVSNKCVDPPPSCGNGTCEADKNEDCEKCPKDCPCQSGLTCQSGVCRNPSKACGDGKCDAAGGENCTTCWADCKCPNGQVCGNGTCAPPPSKCGNGTCDPAEGENCTTCAQDCGCTNGWTCQDNRCQPPPPACGNGSCDPDKNEDCTTCPQDCTCATGQNCQSGQCTTPALEPTGSTPDAGPSLPCSEDEQVVQCDADGKNCTATCPEINKGCGCQAPAGQHAPLWILLALLSVFALRRRPHSS